MFQDVDTLFAACPKVAKFVFEFWPNLAKVGDRVFAKFAKVEMSKNGQIRTPKRGGSRGGSKRVKNGGGKGGPSKIAFLAKTCRV